MSIENITLLQSIGKFDNVSLGDQVPFKRFTVVYAENGSGKTTLSTVFKSLSKGEASYIMDRKRVTSSSDPHIILKIAGYEVTFANKQWSHTYPNIHVFDDIYVADNVCSGIEIEVSHRRNMHEFIIGHKGVELLKKYQEARSQTEIQKKTVDEKRKVISPQLRGPLSEDEFCNLTAIQNVDDEIKNAEYHLATAKSSEAIRLRDGFIIPTLPEFDMKFINQILQKSLNDVAVETSKVVRSHFAKLGQRGEEWVAEGIPLIKQASVNSDHELCPFCDQNLNDSKMILYYQNYFSQSYTNLKEEISRAGLHIKNLHSDQTIMNFENGIRSISETQNFWKNYASIPPLDINVSVIRNTWVSARDEVLKLLRTKMASPLDPIVLSEEVIELISVFDAQRKWFSQMSESLKQFNLKINSVKQKAMHSDINALERNLAILRASKIRFEPNVAAACNEYVSELHKLNAAESNKNSTRVELSKYRDEIFPKYEQLINSYLLKFNAGFQIGSIDPVNDRGGSSVRYSFIIDNAKVPLNADYGPSFRNSLSAGDRSTLAFAFFLAMLDNDEDVGKKIIVIDDPVTSLDETRMSATREVIKNLLPRVQQVIVLSHRKSFLYKLWDEAHKIIKSGDREKTFSGVHISRGGSGSTIGLWKVSYDDTSTYDRSHSIIQNYINNPDSTRGKEWEVGAALRTKLEGYLHIVFPNHFKQGMFLGNFISMCERHLDQGMEIILSKESLDELKELKNYSNQFHHSLDGSQGQDINETELLGYSRRTLTFCSRI